MPSLLHGSSSSEDWGVAFKHVDHKSACVTLEDQQGDSQSLTFDSQLSPFVRSEVFAFVRKLYAQSKDGTIQERMESTTRARRGSVQMLQPDAVQIAAAAAAAAGAAGGSLDNLETPADEPETGEASFSGMWRRRRSSVGGLAGGLAEEQGVPKQPELSRAATSSSTSPEIDMEQQQPQQDDAVHLDCVEVDSETGRSAVQVVNGVNTERRRKGVNKQAKNSGVEWGVIHPLTPWRLGFDYVLAILILYSIVTVPYRLAFEVPALDGWLVFEIVVDCMFGIDIFLNFNTAYFSAEELIGNRKAIAKKYLQEWFFVDFLSTVPFDVIVDALTTKNYERSTRGVRYLRIARLLKLVRLIKLSKVLSKFENEGRLGPSVVVLIQLTVAIFFLGHVLGCGWFMVGTYSLEDQISRGIPLNETSVWIVSSINITGMTPADQWVVSVYWSFTTLTTLGYGDIVPKNSNERVYAMFAMFIGALVFGYVIGNITSLINNMHQEELEKKAIRDDVKSFCKSHRLPPELSWKVRRLINYQMEHQGLYDEKAILSSLPYKVQNDVIDSIVTDNLSKFEYLKGKPPAFCADLLNAALPYLYAANETVWRQGDAPDQIVFIINGEMCSIQDGEYDEEDARANAFMIKAGSVIGDVAVMTKTPRASTVSAVTHCETVNVSQQDMLRILHNHPQFEAEMRGAARATSIDMESRRKAQTLQRQNAARKPEVVDEGGSCDEDERRTVAPTRRTTVEQKAFFGTSVAEKAPLTKHQMFPLLDPSQGFREKWDFVLAVVILYSCLIVPYRMAYSVPALDGWLVFEIMCDCMFGIDIFLNFNTAYFNEDDILITSRKQIAAHYLKFMFWIDLLSTLPVELIMDAIAADAGSGSSSAREAGFLKGLRIIRLTKLVRLAKLNNFFAKLEAEDKVDPNMMRIVKLLFQIVFISHFVGCLYAYTGYFQTDNWLAAYSIEKDPPYEQWGASLYWAVTLLTTVGFGDILPVNAAERLFNIVSMIIGALVFGKIVGDITTVADDVGKETAKRRTKLTMLNSYMAFRKLDKALQYKMRKLYFDNYDHSFHHQDAASSAKIMDMLSGSLREDVLSQMVREVGRRIAHLDDRTAIFVSEFSKILIRQTFIEEEVIMTKDVESHHSCRFITQGSIRVYPSRAQQGMQYLDSDDDETGTPNKVYFGEDLFALPAGVSAPKSRGEVVAQTKVEIYELLRIRFNAMILSSLTFNDDAVYFLRDLKSGPVTNLHLPEDERDSMWNAALRGEGAFEVAPPRKAGQDDTQKMFAGLTDRELLVLQKDINYLFDLIDTDGSGLLSKAEVDIFFSSSTATPLPRVIRLLDTDGDGWISPDEWNQFFADLHVRGNLESSMKMLKGIAEAVHAKSGPTSGRASPEPNLASPEPNLPVPPVASGTVESSPFGAGPLVELDV